MYLKLPIGFNFSSFQQTQQIIDNQVLKYVKTWKKQRIYKSSYGIDWNNFDYDKANDQQRLRVALIDFLGPRLSRGMEQVNLIDVLMGPDNNTFNNFSFYLVYNYKGILQSKVFVNMNLDGQVPVNINLGSF